MTTNSPSPFRKAAPEQVPERSPADADMDEVTARLDAIYARESSELAPALLDAQYRALIESW